MIYIELLLRIYPEHTIKIRPNAAGPVLVLAHSCSMKNLVVLGDGVASCWIFLENCDFLKVKVEPEQLGESHEWYLAMGEY